MQLIVATGSNIGKRCNHLANAKKRLQTSFGKVVLASSIYESEAWGYDGFAYLNQVLVFDTLWTAEDCLTEILRIEEDLGRIRVTDSYADRTIDVDIIAYGQEVVISSALTLPHPRMIERNFVLAPLAEVLSNWTHPILGRTSSELLELCTDAVAAIPFECDTTL